MQDSADHSSKEIGQTGSELTHIWADAAELLAKLDAAARSGLATLIKMDGERQNGASYTVAVSGPTSGDEFFRKDGANLHVLLTAAVEFCTARHLLDDE